MTGAGPSDYLRLSFQDAWAARAGASACAAATQRPAPSTIPTRVSNSTNTDTSQQQHSTLRLVAQHRHEPDHRHSTDTRGGARRVSLHRRERSAARKSAGKNGKARGSPPSEEPPGAWERWCGWCKWFRWCGGVQPVRALGSRSLCSRTVWVATNPAQVIAKGCPSSTHPYHRRPLASETKLVFAQLLELWKRIFRFCQLRVGVSSG